MAFGSEDVCVCVRGWKRGCGEGFTLLNTHYLPFLVVLYIKKTIKVL